MPVLTITILAYKFASETGRRTGSSLLFFSLVFYFIAVYESFYITARFGVIVSTELIFLQAIYISAGVFFASGVVSLRNFFVRFTGLGDLSLSSTFKRILIIVFIFVVLMLPYFLTQAYEGDLYLFNDVLYIFIQLQFFISYFLLGDIMMMNKGVCEKAPRRSRWIRVASLYYLIEPILWLWLLNSNLPNSILDKTYFATEVAVAFGGAGFGTVFGIRRTADFLSKATITLGAIFLLLAIVINLFFLPGKTPESVRESVIQQRAKSVPPVSVPAAQPTQSQPATVPQGQNK